MHAPIIKLHNIAIEDGRKLLGGEAEPPSYGLWLRLKFSAQLCVLIKARQHAFKRAATLHGVSSTRPMPVFQLRTGS